MKRPIFEVRIVTHSYSQCRVTSRPRKSVAGLARGIERFDTLPGAPAGQAIFDHGEWRLGFTRAPATPDTANEGQLEARRAIPGGFFRWGGSRGGHGPRMGGGTRDLPGAHPAPPPRAFLFPGP